MNAKRRSNALSPIKDTPSTMNRPPPLTRAASPNHLLAALPEDVYLRLAPKLESVSFKLKEFLHKPGEPIRHVYFPGGGFCSVLTVLEDGRMVEVATIGREGMIGAFATTLHAVATSGTMVQAEMGTCYRMTAEAFRAEMDRRGAFYELLANYAQALLGFIMQSTACNAVHSVEQRLARWLLLAEDRVGESDFPLTQEFVAIMLGTTRPTVTVVAGMLQRAGLIKYHRGHVTILDRRKLEAASCECYQVATDLLGAVTDASRLFPAASSVSS
jgi:CRP-like cAMP-binding protein